MKKLLFSLATSLLLFPMLIQAQNDAKPLKVKFGKISDEELKMTQYDKDPDAPAVVLFDKGSSSYDFGTTRHIRIKIFKKSAYGYANFSFLYDKSDFIKGLKGACYNMENGKMVETKLEKENIFDESVTKYLMSKKLSISGVREGSIVEYEYTIGGGLAVGEWPFQREIPTMWSEYQIAVPEYYIISKIGQGSTPYLVNRQDPPQNHIIESLWIQKDVPAFKPEKYITSSADYLTKLTFYLEEIQPPPGYGFPRKVIKSWQEESKDLLSDNDYFGIIDKKSAMKDELATVINDGMKPKEKIQAIFDYVGKNFEEVPRRSLFLLSTIKEVKEKKKITASEMNIIMMNMLRTAGIEVRPVLLSTREHGKIGTTLPVYRRFNRVISHVLLEKDTFFIDASSYPHPIELLPFDDLNGGGYEFWGKDSYSIVPISNKTNIRQLFQSSLTLNTEGALEGTIAMISSGYEAVRQRNKIKEVGAEKFSQDLLKDILVSGKLEEQKIEKPEAFAENMLKANFKITTTDYVSKSGDKIYINPLLCFSEKENPFTNPERTLVVDYGSPKEDIVNTSFTIPNGYKVEELPKMVRYQLSENAIKYDYLIEVSGDQIKINTKLSIKRTTFNPNEYDQLRDFYTKIVAKMGEQIVLTKASK